MTERYAIQVKWDGRKSRYVARMKKYPDVIAFGATILEAQDNMDKRVQEFLAKEKPCR